MGIEIIRDKEVTPTHIRAGDTLTVTYKRGLAVVCEVSETMKVDTTVDRFLVVELKDEPGYEYGIGGIIAKKVAEKIELP